MSSYPGLLKLLYLNFAWTHYIPTTLDASSDSGPTLSFQPLEVKTQVTETDIFNEIQQQTRTTDHALVMSSILVFNKAVLKTNFYRPSKLAVSFRMDPGFLSKWEYPIGLFGMFLTIGSEFRGFHLRFRDVARGGIRIVKSHSKEAYSLNARMLLHFSIDYQELSLTRTITSRVLNNERTKIFRKEAQRGSFSLITIGRIKIQLHSRNT
jgi:glutamate dehydrogenase